MGEMDAVCELGVWAHRLQMMCLDSLQGHMFRGLFSRFFKFECNCQFLFET